MQYSKLAELYAHLEWTSARLKKVEAIADFLRSADDELLPKAALLVQGKVFPSWSEQEIGIANLLMVKILSSAIGFPEKEVMHKFKKVGDFGTVAEELAARKRQKTLFQR